MSKGKGNGLKNTGGSGKPATTPQFPAAGRRPAPMVPKAMQRKASGRGR